MKLNTLGIMVLWMISVWIGVLGMDNVRADQAGDAERVVEDFSGIEAGAFPPEWKAVWARETHCAEIYTVVK